MQSTLNPLRHLQDLQGQKGGHGAGVPREAEDLAALRDPKGQVCRTQAPSSETVSSEGGLGAPLPHEGHPCRVTALRGREGKDGQAGRSQQSASSSQSTVVTPVACPSARLWASSQLRWPPSPRGSSCLCRADGGPRPRPLVPMRPSPARWGRCCW